MLTQNFKPVARSPRTKLKARDRRAMPRIESVEPRILLATNFLQGVAYLDSNANSQFDNGEELSGAVVTLYQKISPSVYTQVAQQTTAADGRYLFPSLSAGNYRLTETPPVNTANSSTQAVSQLNQVTGTTTSSIDVKLGDSTPNNWLLSYPSRNKAEVKFSDNGTFHDSYVGQLNVFVNETDIGYTTPIFQTFCVDLHRDIFTGETGLPYTIKPIEQGITQNAGRIAYLYNHFGTSTLPLDQATALQLTIWELEYEQSGTYSIDFSDPNRGTFYTTSFPDPSVSSAAVIAAANAYLAASAGKSELAVYLDGIGTAGRPGGSQGLIATGSLNFGNVTDIHEVPAAELGDFVWEDLNANGVQDAGEPGIPNVTVNLLDSGGSVIKTTQTNTSGYYLFDHLAAGTYSVQFVNPGGGFVPTGKDQGSDDAKDSDADTTTGKTGSYTLAAGDINLTVDAGFYKLAALGDFVWNDLNANGVQDSGEPGIAGAVVTLNGPSGPQTYTTLANGYYQFTGLIPGTYTVSVTTPSGFTATQTGQGTTATDSNGSPTSTTLASGGSDQTLDFGFYQPAALGDFVWLDANANGIQDSGENGVDGVTVKLLDSGGTVIATQTTSGGGKYLFTGLTPGSYSVQFVAPSGYNLSPQNQGGNDAIDSDANTSTGKTGGYTLASGETNLTVDAGLYQPAALGDFVWLDANANGIQDSGENGVDGVTVKLLDSGGTVIATQTTSGGGKYLFTGLTPGSYSVQFVAPSGYSLSPQNQGGNDAIDSDANTSTGKTGGYTLASGETNLTVDAGLYQPAALGDFVWLDANANGIQDSGENGVDGVTVKLLDSGGAVIATQTTSGGGKYLFTGLTPGSYSVQFVAPSGYSLSPQNQGGNDAKDSDANTSTGKTGGYTLASGETNLTVDAGLYQPAALGDFVWLDANANGIQDSGENGVDGVTVKLLDSGGTVIATQTTSGGGKYLFTGLTPGSYSVQFVAPSGYNLSPQNQGGNDAIDSDANTSTGKTGGYTLTSGETNLTVDAGLYQPAALGDFVWLDANANGIQDSGENGVDGVTVKLLDSGGAVIATQTTSGGGKYLFTGLTPGSYSVQFVAPAGYALSPQNQGSNDAKDSDANTSTGKTGSYTLASGETNLTVDAGLTTAPGWISGTKFNDLTGNGLTADDTPMGGVKVYLDKNNDGNLDTGEPSTTTAADGTYTFNGLQPGTYYVREVVPTGWIRTGPTLTDYYKVTIASGQGSSGNDFANAEKDCGCNISNIVYIINGCKQVTSLRGNVDPGDTVTVKFKVSNVSNSNPATFSLVSYTAPGSSFDASKAYLQEVFDMASTTYTTNGNYSLTVDVPNSYFQVDFVCGSVIDRFGPAGSNIFYTPQGRLFSADNGGCKTYDGSLSENDTGTTSFWCGTSGQNLIKSLNGGSSAKDLGNWLASNFSGLYGGLAGKSNSDVASYFKTLKNSSSTKLEAEAMATALSVYVTNYNLAGMAAQGYGFHVSFLGVGVKKFNVGSDGSSLGLSGKVSLWDILEAADSKASNGKISLSSSNRSKATDLFSDLNSDGSVS